MLQTNDSGTGGASIQPCCRVHLQAADGILAKQREQPVVGVLADAVAHIEPRRDRPARIVEDAKEDERVGGVAAREVVGRQVERAGDALHDAMAEGGDLGHPFEDRLPKPGQHVVAGDEVAAMQRHARRHARMLLAQLGAEVQALLPVGSARRQLAAERKPAAPGTTAERHRVARLGLFGKGEEAVAQVFEAPAERLVDAVADDIEEAVRAARFADAVRDLVGRGAQIDQGQVVHRGRRKW